MTRGPDFHELIGEDVPGEERGRLERIHELLVAAGPPPELPPALATPPKTSAPVIALPRRRRGALLVLAAALAFSSFGVGYLLGDRGGAPERSLFRPDRTVVLGKEGSAQAIVRIGGVDGQRNRSMLVTVAGLERQPPGDYYTLFMTRKGKPVATCGTFNVKGDEPTTVRFTIGYGLEGFDGLLLARYRRSDHADLPLLRAKL